MTEFIRSFLLLFLLTGLVTVETGCQTARQTLGHIVFTVDAARDTYADAINLGFVSEEDQVKIDAVVADYQTAMNAALLAASMDLNTQSSAVVAQKAANVIIAINTIASRHPQLITPKLSP